LAGEGSSKLERKRASSPKCFMERGRELVYSNKNAQGGINVNDGLIEGRRGNWKSSRKCGALAPSVADRTLLNDMRRLERVKHQKKEEEEHARSQLLTWGERASSKEAKRDGGKRSHSRSRLAKSGRESRATPAIKDCHTLSRSAIIPF